MTVEELANNIKQWESEAGESFTDYFMHDNVADNSWAFWLIGKGHKRGVDIVHQLLAKKKKGKTFICLDQDLLYNVHQDPDVVYEYDEDGDISEVETRRAYDDIPYDYVEAAKRFHLDALLWAEFLLATPFYTKKITEWLEENE